MLYQCVYSLGVWCVRHVVYEGDSPELDAVQGEIARTRAKRLEAVREYIEGIPDRGTPMGPAEARDKGEG